MKNNEDINFGQEIRKIRKIKELTQFELSDKKISQAQIARIEKGNIIPSYTSFLDIINKLNISVEEFFFITSNHERNLKRDITNFVKELFNTGDIKCAHTALKLCKTYYEEYQDSFYLDMQVIFEAYIYSADNNTLMLNDTLNNKLLEIWNRIFNMEKWYLHELMLISYIVCFFDFNKALDVCEEAIQQIQKYDFLDEARIVNQQLYFSMMVLYIKKEKYNVAIECCNQYFEQNLYGFSIYVTNNMLINKSYCLEKLEKFEENEKLEQIIISLAYLGQKTMTKEEIQIYKKIFIK